MRGVSALRAIEGKRVTEKASEDGIHFCDLAIVSIGHDDVKFVAYRESVATA